jgi:hypothetical protein
MSPACDELQVQIGMRQHGALPAGQAAALDQHLEGCLYCQGFARGAGQVEATLRERAEREAAGVDWESLQGRVRRLALSYRRKLWVAPLFLLQLPLAFLLGTGHLPDRQLLAVVPAANVAIYLGYVWLVSRPFRELMAVVKSGEDLLRGYLRELRRQRLRARIFVVVNLVLATALLATAATEPALRLRLYALGCALLFGGWAAFDLRATLPRLARALGEVGP